MSELTELEKINEKVISAGIEFEKAEDLKSVVDSGEFLNNRVENSKHYSHSLPKVLKDHIKGEDFGEDFDGPDHVVAKEEAEKLVDKTKKALMSQQFDILMEMASESKKPDAVIHDKAIFFKDKVDTDLDNQEIFDFYKSVRELQKDLGVDTDVISYKHEGNSFDVRKEQVGQIGIMISSKGVKDKGMDLEEILDIVKNHMEIHANEKDMTVGKMENLPVYKRSVNFIESNVSEDLWSEFGQKKREKINKEFGEDERIKSKMKSFNSMKLVP